MSAGNGNTFKRPGPRAASVMPSGSTQPTASSSSPNSAQNDERIAFVDFRFNDILERHRSRGDRFVFTVDEHVTAGSMEYSMGCVPARSKFVRPIAAVDGFYLFPLQRGEKIMVKDMQIQTEDVFRTATVHYVVNSPLEEETCMRCVKAYLSALQDGDLNAIADKVLGEAENAMEVDAAQPEPPVVSVEDRASRASTVEAPSARSSVARSDAGDRDSMRMASVERGGYKFPYLERSVGKVPLHSKYPFFVDPHELKKLENIQFVEHYVPGLMDLLLGLKNGPGANNLRTLIQNSNRGGVTNWLGSQFLNCMKDHIFPLVEKRKLRLERGNKEERVTFLVNQHLNKFK
ncbi:uncharacterized protein LOC129585018 [Paramacrobiotus metropolitanus]|uniref:uncharacterized protein LOC129585018 n=1 Tax=Paramacrobiotus metropolitanus TaxID=2943436 RepID=UPI0024465A02|nr:uncharacterized protein LOC129585018 [Paramacrobiotus metropolitanus]XP_055333496.1 uncharacterized protein LOC129585018 [Paramacrobiotus metropolitanus]